MEAIILLLRRRRRRRVSCGTRCRTTTIERYTKKLRDASGTRGSRRIRPHRLVLVISVVVRITLTVIAHRRAGKRGRGRRRRRRNQASDVVTSATIVTGVYVGGEVSFNRSSYVPRCNITLPNAQRELRHTGFGDGHGEDHAHAAQNGEQSLQHRLEEVDVSGSARS